MILRQVSVCAHKRQDLLTYSTSTPPSLGFDSDEKTKAMTKERSRVSIHTQHYYADKASDRSKQIKINVATHRRKAATQDCHGDQESKKRQPAGKAGGGTRSAICSLARAFAGLSSAARSPLAAPKKPEAAGYAPPC